MDSAEMSLLIEQHATLHAKWVALGRRIDDEGLMVSPSETNPAITEQLEIGEALMRLEAQIGMIGPLNRQQLGPAELARRTQLWNRVMRLRGENHKIIDD